jgi:hypothetical protein
MIRFKITVRMTDNTTARPGDEVKLLEHARSIRRQADRAGGDPIVEGGGSESVPEEAGLRCPREALTAPDDDPAHEEIQLVEKLQVQEGPHEGRGAARGDLAASQLLELAHRVGKLAFEQRRVVSVNLGQGA